MKRLSWRNAGGLLAALVLLGLVVSICNVGQQVTSRLSKQEAEPTVRHDPVDVIRSSSILQRRLAAAVERARGHENSSQEDHSAPPLRTEVPGHADGTLVLQPHGSNVRLEVRSAGVQPVRGDDNGGSVVYRDVRPDTDVVLLVGEGRAEELKVLHSSKAPATARYKLNVDANSVIRERDGRIEVVDAHGYVALHTSEAFAVDVKGRRKPVRLALHTADNETQLVASLDPTGLEYPIVMDPEWIAGSGWPAETIVGLAGVDVLQNAHVKGSVAVIDAQTAEASAAEAVLETNVIVDGDLAADTIELHRRATVLGSASFNELLGSGSIEGQEVTPIDLPLLIPVPLSPVATPGQEDVLVDKHETLSLQPGAYSEVTVRGGSVAHPTVLRLTGGTYELEDLIVENHGRVECQDSCTLRLAGRLLTGTKSYLGHATEDASVSIGGRKEVVRTRSGTVRFEA